MSVFSLCTRDVERFRCQLDLRLLVFGSLATWIVFAVIEVLEAGLFPIFTSFYAGINTFAFLCFVLVRCSDFGWPFLVRVFGGRFFVAQERGSSFRVFWRMSQEERERYDCVVEVSVPHALTTRPFSFTVIRQPQGHGWKRAEALRPTIDVFLIVHSPKMRVFDNAGRFLDVANVSSALTLVLNYPHADS